MNHKQQAIAELVPNIKKAGFRVFLAENKQYGFFTDEEGSRVICFQVEFFSPTFSGNYVTDNPTQTGGGWQIIDEQNYSEDFKAIFATHPPSWAVRDSKWRFATLEDHQNQYQASSKYEEQ